MSGTVFIKGGLASVVVSCVGPIARTRRCIDALLRRTRRPWELIAVVEEGSSLATYLEGVRDAAPVHVEVVAATDDPEAFAHARGIEAACGDYLALIDDGTVVTDGWLEGLAALADWDPRIAMVGPMLGDVTPPQRAEGAEALDPAVATEFAERWRSGHRRQWFATDRLAGSCVVLRRSTFEALADPAPRSIDDLGERALGRGLMLAVNRELFVHHAGPGPVRAEAPHRIVPRRYAAEVATPSTRPRDRDHGQRPRVSLTMIVRDEEHNLGPCLESAAGLCDEIVVVDTGSTDRTAEVARSFGAKVVPFAWIDDFAAARNAALDHATGRYAFWLDADDRLDDANRARLLDLFGRLDDGEEAAYVMQQLSTGADGQGATTSADHVRLFPIRDDLLWCYRVHEQILPAITDAGVPVRWTEIAIAHHGYSDPDLTDRKLDRNIRLLGSELLERPGNALVLFNIGWAALTRRDARAALGYLRAAVAAASPYDGLLRKAYVLIADACRMLGDIPAALEACAAGRSFASDDPGLLYAEAVFRQESGDATGAEACWRQILEGNAPRRFSIIAPGVRGHMTRRKLAALAEGRGDLAEALRLWTAVLDECPGDPEARDARLRLAYPAHSVVVSAG
jgi:glycosyltransferase involved in cell wall biosynthesis